jgi:hypothetical protein
MLFALNHLSKISIILEKLLLKSFILKWENKMLVSSAKIIGKPPSHNPVEIQTNYTLNISRKCPLDRHLLTVCSFTLTVHVTLVALHLFLRMPNGPLVTLTHTNSEVPISVPSCVI